MLFIFKFDQLLNVYNYFMRNMSENLPWNLLNKYLELSDDDMVFLVELVLPHTTRCWRWMEVSGDPHYTEWNAHYISIANIYMGTIAETLLHTW